jgi:hypothetical protein
MDNSCLLLLCFCVDISRHCELLLPQSCVKQISFICATSMPLPLLLGQHQCTHVSSRLC